MGAGPAGARGPVAETAVASLLTLVAIKTEVGHPPHLLKDLWIQASA